MGIWGGGGVGDGWFCQCGRGVKAADECGLTAAGAVDDVIDAWSVMRVLRWQALALRSQGLA
jgi:hypothetical protein